MLEGIQTIRFACAAQFVNHMEPHGNDFSSLRPCAIDITTVTQVTATHKEHTHATDSRAKMRF